MPGHDTGALVLAATPPILSGGLDLSAALGSAEARASDDGEYFRYDLGGGRYLNLVRLSGADAGGPLSIVIPIDTDGLDRADAVQRLFSRLLRRRVPEDRRLTRQQRRRARHMLQAVDGRMNGATYREIAGVIYGQARIADEPWKTSALRDAVMDLVKDAFSMIEGGYLSLLRRRRRK
ncbi:MULTISPECIES: DUF2285 domain-containing protein [Alphaproteobacteria]|uniref:DUF2285 domain-containing protein n=1 Tax=Alphaproteobacteria TaxID=28211 RepID=UPI000D1B563D|nr:MULTISPECIES: DUF2285 domain-containing protein [Hyphomicrobiales]KAB2756171.1 DUF2285 domain-containing protein [Brucella anthropi]RSC31705.1 DUF2285 domain-containing protein [Agrobacterium sp. FDAARGOS_525]TKT65701.1 DUF2285 domain-containing protein [Agrobacterium sp. LC34]KAB2794733.1 DUF2285 domain-containing protein [Brucella anthropi]RCI77021.1 DUF2285 domain-containing protein [Brucella anthropi]